MMHSVVEKQARDRRGVLQRAAHNLSRIYDAGLHKILELLCRRIQAEGTLVVLYLIDHHGAFPARVGCDPAAWIFQGFANNTDANLLVLARS